MKIYMRKIMYHYYGTKDRRFFLKDFRRYQKNKNANYGFLIRPNKLAYCDKIFRYRCRACNVRVDLITRKMKELV